MKIYRKLQKYKNIFKLIIKIRDIDYEINDQILENAFGNFQDLIVIRNNIPLDEEIENCDCLISYSSTVLEEALEKNKPVMCFGLPGYNHFYKNNNVKFIEKSTPQMEKLKIIEKCLSKKFMTKVNMKRKIDFFL